MANKSGSGSAAATRPNPMRASMDKLATESCGRSTLLWPGEHRNYLLPHLRRQRHCGHRTGHGTGGAGPSRTLHSSKEAESLSRKTHAAGWRRTREAGQNVEIGPVSASRTAAAFLSSGTQQIHASARNRPGQVIVIAVRGTESASWKCPSPTCWRRQASSSSTIM